MSYIWLIEQTMTFQHILPQLCVGHTHDDMHLCYHVFVTHSLNKPTEKTAFVMLLILEVLYTLQSHCKITLFYDCWHISGSTPLGEACSRIHRDCLIAFDFLPEECLALRLSMLDLFVTFQKCPSWRTFFHIQYKHSFPSLSSEGDSYQSAREEILSSQ